MVLVLVSHQMPRWPANSRCALGGEAAWAGGASRGPAAAAGLPQQPPQVLALATEEQGEPREPASEAAGVAQAPGPSSSSAIGGQ